MTISGTGLNVGSGVKVFRGVGVIVAGGVRVGMAAAVCSEAAFAVSAMNRLMAFGSRVPTGVGVMKAGTQEVTRKHVMNQIRIALLDDGMTSRWMEIYSSTIACTRPTAPLSSRTLIPWGWVGDFVSISLTIPRVNLPVR